MYQLTQKLKTGELKVEETPIPIASTGKVLVQNYYSLISAGTESSTLKTARKGYLGKAKERPEQVKQVLQTLKAQGPVQTYRAVMKKLDSLSPMGYSCAGEVIGIGDNVRSFEVGDRVACGGLSACHAEIISVPENLCVKLESNANLKNAAYNTLGAIAMQGVRQADLHLGETCAVIGLGLLGQLTGLLLQASGVRVIGIDVATAMVELASKNCVDIALNRSEIGIEERIFSSTNGLGCDAVIITAASISLDPINFAGAICRKRGTIVVVGAVPTGFNREPHYYKKELQIKMSCSYGPGRYDPIYEEKGIDYPAAYVRWTEKRNMQAFQLLLQQKKVNIDYLTTHTFKLDEAPVAYEMMMEKSAPFIGIIIEYDTAKKIKINPILNPKVKLKNANQSDVNIGFIGAGSYAQGNLLPNIPKQQKISLKGVLTSSGTTSRSVLERFGFEFCTSEQKDLLSNDNINTIFIATRHDSHAEFVIKSLKAGKNVFVEKPLCLNIKELDIIKNLFPITNSEDRFEYNHNHINNKEKYKSKPILLVGFNRRFAPLTKKLKSVFPNGPISINYRINAGSIPEDSWVHDPELGGGRIVGEVCHFVDFLTYLNGSLPVSVYAIVMKEQPQLNDILNISISFANGSIGVISYLSNGDKSFSKERIEVFGNGCAAVLKDFKSLAIYTNGKCSTKKMFNQDKGQKVMVNSFIDAISNGTDSPIPLSDIYSATLTTFKIMESIREGSNISV